MKAIKYIPIILFILNQILLGQGLITDVETHSNGKLNKISFYKESQQGIELVKEKFYYQTGAIKREINYKGNSLHGKWVSYYPNGKRQSERMYQLGEERSVRFYSKGGVPMGPINIIGSWVVSEVADVKDLPFKEGYMMEFKEDGIVKDSNLKDMPYEIKDNRVLFTKKVCESTKEPLSFVISLEKNELTFFIDPFECPERGKKAPTDVIWLTLTKSQESIDEFIAEELEELEKAMLNILEIINVKILESPDSIIIHKNWDEINFYNIFNSSDDMDALGIADLPIKNSIKDNWEIDLEIMIYDQENYNQDQRVNKDFGDSPFSNGIYFIEMRLKADHGDRRGDSDELYLHYDLMSGIIRVANDWRSYNQLIEDSATKMLMKSMEENDDAQPANDQP